MSTSSRGLLARWNGPGEWYGLLLVDLEHCVPGKEVPAPDQRPERWLTHQHDPQPELHQCRVLRQPPQRERPDEQVFEFEPTGKP
jgi:hypothetical protein